MTPISSPRNQRRKPGSQASAHASSPAAASGPEQAGPSRSGSPPQPRPAPPAPQMVAEPVDHADGRYSLRTRQARQLNPYEYDKRLYKQQMRANPEAIVKVVSPPRPRRHHRSTSAGANDADGSSGAEDEYHGGAEDEAGLDQDARWERRLSKGKGRAGDSMPEERRGRAEKPAWLPDILKDLSSGSSSEEDNAALDALARQYERERRKKEKEERQKEKEERRKKHKPHRFPLSKKDMQSSVSPARMQHQKEASREPSPPHPRTQPRPRPRPRQRVASSPIQADEPAPEQAHEPEAGPSTTWNRHRSVTFTSPVRSPPHDAFSGWDEDLPTFDDGPARPDSPVPLPPTPAEGTDDGTSSEGHLPPPVSSTPPDVIEVTSDDDEELNLTLRRRPRALPIGLESGQSESESPSGSGSGSGSGSDEESMAEEDRRRMKALERMMPKALINRLMQKQKDAAVRRAHRSASRSENQSQDEQEEEERPLRPGQSRRRIRSHTLSSRSIEIRGDSESSDVDMADADAGAPSLERGTPEPLHLRENARMSDAEADEIRPIGHQPRPRARSSGAPRSPISVSDTSELGRQSDVSDISSSSSEGEDAGPARRRSRYDGEAREGDLIDRMLSRTNLSTRTRMKRKRRRPGAKRYGQGQQTLLPFKRLPTPDSAEDRHVYAPDPPSPPSNYVEFGEEAPQKSKAKKQKGKQKSVAGLYVFTSGGAHLVSGRTNSAHVTVNQESAARGGPYMGGAEPQPRHKHKSKSKGKRPPSKAGHAPTLEQYWTLGAGGDGGEESDDSFVVPDAPAAHPQLSQQTRAIESLHRVTVHMDIHPLPAGIAFPNTTYLGRGWLYELVNLLPGTHVVPSPPSCSMFDCALHPDMAVDVFNSCLDSVYDQVRNLILGASNPADHETCGKWQGFLHALAQHLSWLLTKSDDGAHAALVTDTQSLVQRLSSLMEEPVEVLPDDEQPNPLVVQIQWFLVEASCRLACARHRKMEVPDLDMVSTCVKALMSKLWDFSFGNAALPIELSKEGLTTVSEAQQIAELWTCLLILANDSTFEASYLAHGASFWTLYLQVLQTKGLQTPQTDLKVREAMWRSFFTLCALSQFSLHGNSSMAPRLPASWQVVASVLERAPLAADPVVDKAIPHRILRKRDEYVRVLVSRCLWLNFKWHWRLDVDDTSLVFNRLLDVFKSRRFASLEDEPSDYPGFLLHNNLLLLHESNRNDTAFTLFLKLVVRAADELRKQNPELARAPTIPARLKKILSLAVPVGSVPFTKASPPTMRELSMLYNRFSAVAVAIYLEPTLANLKYRLSNARRYVNFKDTDDETRRACIRGAMQLGILLRHLDLPLTDILDWMAQMTNTLIDEYQEAAKGKAATASAVSRTWVVVSIQLLLGGIRRILETASMNPEENRHKYPEPALLEGPWVARVFSTSTTLSSITSTGDQIRRFVQAFLDARALVIPRPCRPQPRVVTEDSQESQYDYDQFDLDLDDPELLAALGEDVGTSEHAQNKEKEKAVCEVIDKVISPAIYRLVCKHFSDPAYQKPGELHFNDADNWIDCWVGCASVVVQNGKKDWNFYLSFGPQSWETIADATRRRRVGLRFMYMLLQLDSPAYLTYTDRFINVLFECLAARLVTLEHDYASLLFSVDKLHHPLLHELPVGDPGVDGDYHFTKHEFAEKRLAFLGRMLNNLSDNLNAEAEGESSLTAHNNIHITSVIGFMSAMRDILDHLEHGTLQRTTYLEFCKSVFALLSALPRLSTHPRLTTLMTWLRDVSQ
ncbi:hypothetical protein VTO73DRAFT_5666 [Trametes versicolor]